VFPQAEKHKRILISIANYHLSKAMLQVVILLKPLYLSLFKPLFRSYTWHQDHTLHVASIWEHILPNYCLLLYVSRTHFIFLNYL